MIKLRSFFGYAWALATLPIVLATFIGMNTWSRGLADVTGVKISPWYSGGDVAKVLPHNGFTTTINRPVFDGLVFERKKGFVQIKWTPDKSRSLPSIINEEIDFDGDGTNDFRIKADTQTQHVDLTPYNPNVTKVDQIVDMEKELAVRVGLLNPRRH